MGIYKFDKPEIIAKVRPTLLDNIAAHIGIKRKYEESDYQLKDRILDTYANKSNSTTLGLINTLSRELDIPRTIVANMNDPYFFEGSIYVEWDSFTLSEIDIFTKEKILEIELYKTNPTIRKSNKYYNAGDIVIHPTDSTKWLECILDGTTSSSNISFSKILGDTIYDGEVEWKVIEELSPKSLGEVIEEYNQDGAYYIEVIDDFEDYYKLPAPYIINFTSVSSLSNIYDQNKVLNLGVKNIIKNTLHLDMDDDYIELVNGTTLTANEYSVNYSEGIITFGSQPSSPITVHALYNLPAFPLVYFPIKLYNIFTESAKKRIILPLFDDNGDQVREQSLITNDFLENAYINGTNKLKSIKKQLDNLYPLVYDNKKVGELW